MDKSEININRIDQDDRPLKGLRDEGKVFFKCTECKESLLCLQLVSTEGSNHQVLTRVVVRCGICGNYSAVGQVSGQFFPGVTNDRMQFEIIDSDFHAPEADVIFEAKYK